MRSQPAKPALTSPSPVWLASPETPQLHDTLPGDRNRPLQDHATQSDLLQGSERLSLATTLPSTSHTAQNRSCQRKAMDGRNFQESPLEDRPPNLSATPGFHPFPVHTHTPGQSPSVAHIKPPGPKLPAPPPK